MSEEEKEEEEEIPVEVVYDALRAAAIVSFFEKEFGKMPHPLWIFKFRKWVDDFEVFLKGVALGEKLAEKLPEVVQKVVQKAEKKRTIEVMGEDEERADC